MAQEITPYSIQDAGIFIIFATRSKILGKLNNPWKMVIYLMNS